MIRNRLQQYREGLSLSRRQLAGKSGVSHETIRRLETIDDCEPSIRVARTLADFFHSDLDTLFTVSPERRLEAVS